MNVDHLSFFCDVSRSRVFFPLRGKMPISFLDTWMLRSANRAWPCFKERRKKSIPPSLVIFSVSASPSFISKWLHINASCHVWPGLTGRSGRHAWVRDRGHGEDGRSECKQSLSLSCQLGSGALCDSARLRSQDKNVFDIVCNCVMFALLVSGGVCISKQAFDCQLRRSEAFPLEFRETKKKSNRGIEGSFRAVVAVLHLFKKITVDIFKCIFHLPRGISV